MRAPVNTIRKVKTFSGTNTSYVVENYEGFIKDNQHIDVESVISFSADHGGVKYIVVTYFE